MDNLYNTAGQKISKFVSSVNTNNTVKHVEYLDGFQYTGGELNFFPHPEGYVNVTLSPGGKRIFNYIYNYTDHLGNIRLSYTQDPVNNQLKIMEENHYYPFGLKHQKYIPSISMDLKAIDENTARPANATSTPYNYKYNGQEWQDELGLNMYDMDMRQYDPAIARWVVLDPVIHHSMSPYNAFDNNPVFWADPSGADATGSVFDSLGTEVSSLTNISSGFSIGAGGSDEIDDSSHRRGEGAKPPKDTSKKSWFGRMFSKIGKLFGGGGKTNASSEKASGGTVDQGIDIMGMIDDIFTKTETTHTEVSKGLPLVAEITQARDVTEGKPGVINLDISQNFSNNFLSAPVTTNLELNAGPLSLGVGTSPSIKIMGDQAGIGLAFDFSSAGTIVGSKYSKVNSKTTNSTSFKLGPIGQIGAGAAMAALPEVFTMIMARQGASAIFR